jgi:hypothetical protein
MDYSSPEHVVLGVKFGSPGDQRVTLVLQEQTVVKMNGDGARPAATAAHGRLCCSFFGFRKTADPLFVDLLQGLRKAPAFTRMPASKPPAP